METHNNESTWAEIKNIAYDIIILGKILANE